MSTEDKLRRALPMIDAVKRELRVDGNYDYRSWAEIKRALAATQEQSDSAPVFIGADRAFPPVAGLRDLASKIQRMAEEHFAYASAAGPVTNLVDHLCAVDRCGELNGAARPLDSVVVTAASIEGSG